MTYSQEVFRFYKDTRTKLSPVSASPTLSYQLVSAPGYFQYNPGMVYDLTQPGLYTFTHYSTAGQTWNNTSHMIVPDPSGDPTPLLSAAAWLSAFGTLDNGLTITQQTNQAKTSMLRLLCGPLHEWTKATLLDPVGVTSRIVQFLTADTPNNYVDGHETLEVRIGGSWALHDLSLKRRFRDATTGALLSARDAVTAIASNSFAYEKLGLGACAVEAQSGQFDATSYFFGNLLSEDDVSAWHSRVFQSIGIQNGSQVWWKMPLGAPSSVAAYITGLSSGYVVKDAATWDATFY